MMRISNEKIGLIQTRGLGDIVIALPIAKHYADMGCTVVWPILASWISHFKHTAPYVQWLPVEEDQHGRFFYERPLQLLQQYGVSADNTICLYQSLSGGLIETPVTEFQLMSFDQYKYSVANVPFIKKWSLPSCISRQTARETALYNSHNCNNIEKYAVTHLTGSDFSVQLGVESMGMPVINITQETDCLFDWLTIIENASVFIALDSVYANLVDMMGINNQVDCYFVPRSHIQLTPVMGNNWTYYQPTDAVKKKISIFSPAR